MTLPHERPLSGGFINELTYVSLAYGLMIAAEDLENGKSEEIVVIKRGANYKVNKQIERRISKLKQELWDFMSNYKGQSERVLTKVNKLIRLATSHIKDTIQYDYLACMILHLRFAPNERNRPLHQDFQWIVDKEGQLFAIIDLLSHTEASNKEGEMFNLADLIVRDL